MKNFAIAIIVSAIKLVITHIVNKFSCLF